MLTSAGLIERDAELSVLSTAIGRAAAGAGSVVMMEGQAGIGKTRLLRVAQELATARGFLQLGARASESDRDFDYGMVHQLLDRLVASAEPAERTRLFAGAARLAADILTDGPAAGDGVVAERSTGVDHGLYWLVANLADRQPVLVAVDDAQWADLPSLRFLVHLAPRLDGLRVLVVVTSRAGELADRTLYAELAGQAKVLAPAPLSIHGTGQMLSDLVGDQPAEVVESCYRATGGNPFLLRELATAISSGTRRGVRPASIDGMVPPAVARAVQIRLARLPAECQVLAASLAVLGDGAELRHVAALADLDLAAALAAMDELVSVAIWTADPRPTFSHPIVRNAITSELAPGRRAVMHRRAAQLLTDERADPERVALHLAATVPNGEQDVVDRLRQAAHVAHGRGATRTAVRWLRRALAEPAPERQRGDILAELGTCELRAADPVPAVEHLRESLALTVKPQDRARRALVFARSSVAAGQEHEAIAVLTRSLDDAAYDDRELRLRLASELFLLTSAYAPDHPALDRWLAEARRCSGATVGERLMLAGLAVHGMQHGTASAQQVAYLARRALDSRDLLDDLTADSAIYYQPGLCLAFAEQPHDAADSFAAAVTEARLRGSRYGVALAYAMWAVAANLHGDVAAAEVHGREAWDAVLALDSTQAAPFQVLICGVHYATALRERDHLDQAQAVVDHLMRYPGLDRLSGSRRGHLMLARGLQHAASGRLEAARDDFRATRDLNGPSTWDPNQPWRGELAMVLTELGERREAMALADEHLAGARRWGTPSAIGGALRVSAIAGNPRELVTGLVRAVDTLRSAADRLTLARALIELGAAQNRTGDPDEARANLREGCDLAHRCGARVLARRAQGELRQTGARPRQPAFSGGDSLTASERLVAEEALQGHTNQQIAQKLFVTKRTVESHLNSIYRKLGIKSRAELAASLAASSSAMALVPPEKFEAPVACFLCSA